MPVRVSAERLAGVVERLRAAGCVFAEDEADLLVAAADSAERLDELTGRRTRGHPLEVLLGWAEFRGHRVAVHPGVFVPRRRSELLVERALAAAGGRPGQVVLDLCCGTGALGLALVTELDGARLWATDSDPAAVACARRNLAPVGGRVLLGDLDVPLPATLAGRVDLLVAVTPYVPSGAIALLPPEARLHEPRPALDGGPDGLDMVRRLAARAPYWLTAGGTVVTETGGAQAGAAAAVLAGHGLTAEIARDPETGATAVVGRRPPGR